MRRPQSQPKLSGKCLRAAVAGGVAALGLLASSTAAFSQDSGSCPDYAQHHAVLEQGRSSLETNPASRGESGGLPYRQPHLDGIALPSAGFQFPADMRKVFTAPRALPARVATEVDRETDWCNSITQDIRINQLEDARRTFAHVIRQQPVPACDLAAEDVAKMIALCDNSDKQNLEQALNQWIQKDTFTYRSINTIAAALKKKRWSSVLESHYKTDLNKHARSSARAFKVIDVYEQRRGFQQANTIYNSLLTELSHPAQENMLSCMNDSGELAEVISRIEASGEPTYTKTLVRAKLLKDESDQRIHRLDCLNLANNLVYTALQLEGREDYAGAIKLYESALDIRKKNLEKNDQELVEVTDLLARARRLQRQKPAGNVDLEKKKES